MASHHHRLVQDSLLESARLFGGKEALVAEGRRLSYSEWLDRSLRLGRSLQDLGTQPGDRVAVFMENGVDAAISIYGIWLAGGVVMVVNPQTKADKLAYLLADSQARIVLTHANQKRIAQRSLEAMPAGSIAPVVVVLDANGDGERSFADVLQTTPPEPRDPKTLAIDLAALIYTSGSTGNPKGVMVTHQNVTFTLGSLTEYLRLSSDDRMLNLLPLAFNYGLYQLLMAVRMSATLILEAGFGYPAVIEQRIRDEAVTVFPGVPTVFSTFLSRSGTSLPSVRRVTNTAASLSPGLLPAIREKFPQALLFKMYGLTECKRACYLEPEEAFDRPESVGKAIPGTEVFLLDHDGNPVGPDQPGILHVRGPHVMVGYWNKPAETAHMLRPGRNAADRVLCTHDVFRMDKDGYLYFVGRTDDIIKTRGEKVSPAEVENVLYGIPGIRDAAVIGVADPLLGEAIRAFVSRTPGSNISEREIRRCCQEKLESFMVPKEFVFLEDLPKTDTGKIRKKNLAALQPNSPAISDSTTPILVTK
ncbi:MAG: class I adenylate-forming enzyme family protein [Gemmataceae bacterium]